MGAFNHTGMADNAVIIMPSGDLRLSYKSTL